MQQIFRLAFFFIVKATICIYIYIYYIPLYNLHITIMNKNYSTFGRIETKITLYILY